PPHAQAAEEALTRTQLLAAAAAGLLGVGLFPVAAYAWTPGTHVYLGESVLANLHQLTSAVADLLRAFPYDFLYGNIAADTSMAKKYAPVGRHCHAWHVGQEIFDLAHTDSLRASADPRARTPWPSRCRRRCCRRGSRRGMRPWVGIVTPGTWARRFSTWLIPIRCAPSASAICPTWPRTRWRTTSSCRASSCSPLARRRWATATGRAGSRPISGPPTRARRKSSSSRII